MGVEVLPGPESRGGEYIDEPDMPNFVGGGESGLRPFRPGLDGVDIDGPCVDDRECMASGSVEGGGPDWAYRVGERIGPGKPIEVDGLRGAGGRLRGGDRPSGDPRPKVPE